MVSSALRLLIKERGSWSSSSSFELEEEEVDPRRAQKSAPSPSYEVIQDTPPQPVTNQGVLPPARQTRKSKGRLLTG